jgi:TfoX/Sxy family transcriptional regulator of competence genes
MVYDVGLADRMREVLAGEPAVTEKRMFGGLAFLVAGHLAVCATNGGLMVRIDPSQGDALLTDVRASRMVMQGRELSGWLLVDLDESAAEEELARWISYGVDYARSLPPKEAGGRAAGRSAQRGPR